MWSCIYLINQSSVNVHTSVGTRWLIEGSNWACYWCAAGRETNDWLFVLSCLAGRPGNHLSMQAILKNTIILLNIYIYIALLKAANCYLNFKDNYYLGGCIHWTHKQTAGCEGWPNLRLYHSVHTDISDFEAHSCCEGLWLPHCQILIKCTRVQ